jgi:heptosyltransferase I
MPPQYHNILLIKPSSLGDIVHTLPAFAALRAAFPQAKITWLIRPEFAPLLECIPGIDEKLLFDRKQLGQWYVPAGWKVLQDFVQSLRQKKFDLVLDLQGLFRTALFAKLSGCPARVGMANARECAPLFYTQKVPPPSDSLLRVEVDRALLKAIGITDFSAPAVIQPPAKPAEAVERMLSAAGLGPKCFAIIIPGAAHSSKCWPMERFCAVAERLTKVYGLPIAAVGTASEKKIVQAIAQHCTVPIMDFCGQTTIPQLVALLGQAAIVVSNDTGPGHIAVAMQTPTVIIFGPTNPAWVRPYQQPQAVVAIDPEGRGKAIRSRNPIHRIDRIGVSLVTDAIGRQLSTRAGGR